MTGECKNCHRPSKGTFNGEEYCGIHLRSEKNAEAWRKDVEVRAAMRDKLRGRLKAIGLCPDTLHVYSPDWSDGWRVNLSTDLFERLLDIAEEAVH